MNAHPGAGHKDIASGSPHPILFLGAYLASMALVTTAIAQSERWPIPDEVLLPAFFVIHVLAGVQLGWPALPFCVLVVPLSGYIAANVLGSLYVVVGVVIFGTPTAIIMAAIGITVSKRVALAVQRRERTKVLYLAMLTIPIILAASPLAIGFIQKSRTVHGERANPLPIDERRGRFAGVSLGRPYLSSEAARGARERAGAVRFDVSYQPSSYRRVRKMLIHDNRAETLQGVGIGDSMSIVRRRYPGLRCSEDSYGHDDLTPFPVCEGRVGPHTRLRFEGDYGRPGVPVNAIQLSWKQGS